MAEQVEVQKDVKAGVKSSEFWITVLVSVGALLGAFEGVLPPKWAALVAGASSFAYALSRGLAKK